MNKFQRITSIRDYLKTHPTSSINEIALHFNVSEMTIRRDLKIFKDNNIIKIAHGIVHYNSDENPLSLQENQYELYQASISQSPEKSRIGKFAASLVQPDDVIFIDAGSTTLYMATYIPKNIPYTVFCYSANTMFQLKKNENIKLTLLGGLYHQNTEMFDCQGCIEYFKKSRIGKAFVSAAGIHATLGVTASNQYEILPRQTAIDSAAEKYLLVDSSKFDKVQSYLIADISRFNAVITDKNISEEWVQRLTDMNIKCYRV